MMFASETVVHSGAHRGEGRSSFSNSPASFSSPQALSTPTSPVDTLAGDCLSPGKVEPSSYFPSTSIMKLEPLSPQSGFVALPVDFTGKGRYGSQSGCMDWQAGSPGTNSLDSLPPYSPNSNSGMPTALSPITSPLSNYSTTTTLSPSGKIGRDDLSPASSLSGFSIEHNEKKKKGPSSRQSDELCLVCGDRSSGYHYNALTCEGCKGFFRRSITKSAVYVCKYGKNCEMDMYMRRKCQECRFKKCINVGMRPDCVTQSLESQPTPGVVPEQQCKVRRDQKKTRDKDKPKDSGRYSRAQASAAAEGGYFPQPSIPVRSGGIVLTKDQQELINKLVYNQERYESPSPEMLKAVEERLAMRAAGSDYGYGKLVEMTRVTVELIVTFAQNAPGFDQLIKNDQVTLLKPSTAEVITLRASRKYHAETDSIVFADNSPLTSESYTSASMDKNVTEAVFAFCRKMNSMNVDNAEYALLTGITIFSERPHLSDVKTVEMIQYLYVTTLLAYVYNKGYSQPGLMFAKLLDVLTQLRSLGILNYDQCEKFVKDEKVLPDLLSEIWDIKR